MSFLLFLFVLFSLRRGNSRNKGFAEETCNVLVTSLDAWGGYVTREYHDWMLLLSLKRGWQAVEPNMLVAENQNHSAPVLETEPFLLQLQQSCQGKYPNFVLFAEMYGLVKGRQYETLSLLRQSGRTKLGFWMNDLQNVEFRDMGVGGRRRFFNTFDVVFGPYTYLLHVFYPEARPQRLVWLPNSVSIDMQNVTFQQVPARSRVFVPGARDNLWYPVRTWAQEIARTDNRSEFVTLEHPGYHKKAYDVQRSSEALTQKDLNVIHADVRYGEYANLTSQFMACLTDLQRISAVLSKHFEMPAAGCLLLTSDQSEEVLSALGFQHMTNCVLYDRKNPMETIDWVLDPMNRHQVNSIREAGFRLVHQQHLVQHRAELIDKVIKHFLRGERWEDKFIPPQMTRANGCPCTFIGESDCECFKKWELVIQSSIDGGEPLKANNFPENFRHCQLKAELKAELQGETTPTFRR